METAALHLKITSDGMDQAKKGLDGLENAASLVEGAVRKMVAAFALFKAGSFIGELTTLAARYETLGVVMKVVGNNAGYTSAQMEAYAQGLQKAGISMLESRNTLAMMASAHIDLANATKLGRIAQDAAVIGNLNSSESFQRMIYGIQSGQVEILRTIGLNVNFEQSFKKLAVQLRKNVADLTEVEKVQARTNAVMEKGGDIAGAYEESLGTVGKAAKSMERIWENLQVILGSVFQKGFTTVVDGMTTAMQNATEWAKKNGTALDELGTSIRGVLSAGGEFTKLLSDIGGGSQGASEGVGFLTRVFQGVSLIIAGATDVLRAFIGTAIGAVSQLVQYLGKAADLATRLAGWSGKGGISQFGDSMQAFAQGILNPLNEGTATGRTLDGMMPSHAAKGSSFAEEQARIAAAAARKAEADKKAAEAAAAAARAAFVKVKEYGVTDHQYFSVAEGERNIPDLTPATMDVHDLELAMIKARREASKLRLDVVTNWDIIGRVIEENSQNATDAMVRWMDNLDGVGRSWETLGQTVRNVIADMLIQMQRAIIQQQVMGPLMQWGLEAAKGLFAPSAGTSPTTGGSAGGGLNYGEAYSATPTKGGPQANVQINVTPGGAVDAKSSTAAGVDLFKAIQPALNAWAAKESRSGGILARA